MTGIAKINSGNSVRHNFKKVLGYAVKERIGYYYKLRMLDELQGETADKIKLAGFINVGQTLNDEKFSITKLGDKYYQDVFGRFSYWEKRLAGGFNRFKKNLFNK